MNTRKKLKGEADNISSSSPSKNDNLQTFKKQRLPPSSDSSKTDKQDSIKKIRGKKLKNLKKEPQEFK